MDTVAVHHKIIVHRLQLQWTVLAGVSIAFLIITARLLAEFMGWPAAMRWLSLSLGITLLLLWTLWRNLSTNHRHAERQLFQSLGAGNTVTFLRGLFIAATAGFLLIPPTVAKLALVPAAFYTFATLGDFFDGYVARRQDQITRLGEILDMYVDGIGVLVATLLLIHYEKVPVWFLLIGLARYLFLAGIWLRQRVNLPVYPLPPSDIRRALAAIQMSFIFILLWPLFYPPATTIAAAAFAIPFLANFLRDWLIVSGVIAAHAVLPTRVRLALFDILPFLLRFAIFIISILTLLSHWMDISFPLSLVAPINPRAFENPLTILSWLSLLLTVLLSLGIAGRTVALSALLLMGIYQNFTPLSNAHMLLIVLWTAVFHFGTGPISMWKPEERLITLRAGQRLKSSLPPELIISGQSTSLREAS